MQGVARARRVARSWPAPTAQCSWRRRRCRCERRSSDELPAGLNLQRGRLLSSLCTWRCGGPARLFAEASSAAQLQRLLLWARSARVATVVIGRGSNCLFDDNGFNGLVILNAVRGLAVTQTEPGRCLCTLGAGTHLYVAAARTAVLGWGGLGWAAAIPGTVGGAVAGNAGADGADMASMLQSVTVVTADGVQELPVNGGSADGWGYRQSPFQRLPCGSVAIASATVRLQLDPHARERLREGLQRRTRTQPLASASAGSVFRNPPAGDSAGRLIDAAGLKGERRGGAAVSTLHANFIVTDVGARSADISALIEVVRERVAERTGIVLQEEVVRIPYDDFAQQKQ